MKRTAWSIVTETEFGEEFSWNVKLDLENDTISDVFSKTKKSIKVEMENERAMIPPDGEFVKPETKLSEFVWKAHSYSISIIADFKVPLTFSFPQLDWSVTESCNCAHTLRSIIFDKLAQKHIKFSSVMAAVQPRIANSCRKIDNINVTLMNLIYNGVISQGRTIQVTYEEGERSDERIWVHVVLAREDSTVCSDVEVPRGITVSRILTEHLKVSLERYDVKVISDTGVHTEASSESTLAELRCADSHVIMITEVKRETRQGKEYFTWKGHHADIINLSRLQQDLFLGAGGFGAVWLYVDKKTGAEYAVKKVHNNGDENSYNTELRLLTRLSCQHTCLVKLVGVARDPDCPNMYSFVMEYYPNSLEDCLEYVELSDTHRAKILVGIAHAMVHLHSRKIIHRDLKPANVFIDANFVPHVGDLGIAYVKSDDFADVREEDLGTPDYSPPEYEVTTKFDVYSYGVIIEELFAGCPMVDWFSDLQERCCARNYQERPEFTEILEIFKHNDYMMTEDVEPQEIHDFIQSIRSYSSTYVSCIRHPGDGHDDE